METTVFRTSRVQHRGSKSINLSSENWEPVTPNMVPANSVLSHSGSRRRASADGWFVCFPVLLRSPCWHSRQVTASIRTAGHRHWAIWASMACAVHSGAVWLIFSSRLFTWKHSDWICLSQVGKASRAEKKKQPTLNKVSLSNSFALSIATFPFATALT